MAKEYFVKTINSVRKEINDTKRLLGTWQAVAAKYGLNRGMIYMIAVNGYEPKTPRIRKRLGLSVMLSAPACRECGDVHVAKRCPRKPETKHWRDWPDERIRWAFENREEAVRDTNQMP